MSEQSDADKTRAVLDELESWAEDEISHLERQFEARHKKVYLPYRVRCRVWFLGGLFCGLVFVALLLYWQSPDLCGVLSG